MILGARGLLDNRFGPLALISCLYSLNLLEEEFCELRLYRVLRSSSIKFQKSLICVMRVLP
jgi:hypothetical protein